MKKENIKKIIKHFTLLSVLSIIMWSCEREIGIEDISSQKSDLKTSIIRGNRLSVENELVLKTLAKYDRTLESNSRNIYVSEYDFVIDTVSVLKLETPELTSYTFQIYRDNSDPNFLENYVLTIYPDDTYHQFLAKYPVISEGVFDKENPEFTIINDEQLVNRTSSCSTTTSFVDAEVNCVLITCSIPEHYGGLLCEGNPDETPYEECDVVQVQTTNLDCDDPVSGGSTDGSNAGGSTNNSTTNPYSYYSPANQVISALGYDISSDEANWLYSHNNNEAVLIKNYLTVTPTQEKKEFAKNAITALIAGIFTGFDFILNNRTFLNVDPISDPNDNTQGGEDTTQYADFDPSQETWPTVAPIIPANRFIGWGYDALIIEPDCMTYSKIQIENEGYQISNYFNSTGQTIQVYKEPDGVNQTELTKGLSYLKYALQNGIPVIVGVDAVAGVSPNPQTDNTTDHFVVIVGMGEDAVGKYFTFFDNATNQKPFSSYGASPENKLYYDSSSGLITGTSNSDYSNNSGLYILTMIRKSKPL